MFKKILVLGLLVSMSAQTFAADFSDVESSDENAEAIYSLQEEGVLEGYSDGSFKPNQSLNRAELMKIAVLSAGYGPLDNNLVDCFKDVSDQWFAPYVCLGEERGWVSGYSDGYFRPEQAVNKVEALKMLLEVFGVSTPAVYRDPFMDVNKNEWYAKYVNTAKLMGLLEESVKYSPAAKITRAGVSENLYRLIDDEKERFLAAGLEMMCNGNYHYALDVEYADEFKAILSNYGFAVYEKPDLFSPLKYRYRSLVDIDSNAELADFCKENLNADKLTKVSVLPKTSWEFGFGNEVTTDDYSIVGDILTLNVGYGGCGVSDFTLFWNGGTWKDAQLGLVRNHGIPVPDVQCEAYLSETLRFDLSPIKEAYWANFNAIPEVEGLAVDPLDWLEIDVYGGANQSKTFSIEYSTF